MRLQKFRACRMHLFFREGGGWVGVSAPDPTDGVFEM